MFKVLFSVVSLIFALSARADVASIKKQILKLAESYKGQGDPDVSKQKSLEVLVEKLLVASPQGPVSERLPLIYGAWQQVWGPYKYKGDDRGVDPSLDPNNIFQVVFEGGYYYNVNPSLDRFGRPEKTVLLRGEITESQTDQNTLEAKFTDLREIKGLPKDGLDFIDLPELSEERMLDGERTTLPRFLVRLLFKGGFLREVYTDHDLRILFGTGRDGDVQDYIYIMKRVQ